MNGLCVCSGEDEWWNSDQALCLCVMENDRGTAITSVQDCPAHGVMDDILNREAGT